MARFTDDEVILLIGSIEDEAKDLVLDLGLLGIDGTWKCNELLGKDFVDEAAPKFYEDGYHMTMAAQRGYVLGFKR